MSQLPQIQSKENPYALDSSSAESQEYAIEATTAIDDKRSTLRDEKTLQLPDNRGPAYEIGLQFAKARGHTHQTNSYAKYLDPYARVWSLYLKETEAEDKELVEFWKDGLDSLLIFAGLFAAVLTAFLIESRKGLEDNPVKVLLQQINQSLRDNTSAPEPRPFSPGLSLPINFLWFISLVLTLISGLSAVLAQGWIRKYLPLTAGRTGRDDAYRRHLRVIRAHQWHLTSILGVIPLLLQLSVLLFLVGLVIFVWSDSHGLGQVIVAITGVTLALYAIATVLPSISAENPIQTTLSSVFYHNDSLSNRSPYRLLRSATPDSAWPSMNWESLLHRFKKPDQDTITTLILAWIIANSKQDDSKDEAVRAIAGLKGQCLETLSAFTVCQASPGFFKRLEAIMENNDSNPEEELNDSKEAYFIVTLKLIAIGQPVESFIEVLKEECDSVRAKALYALADFSLHTKYLQAIKGTIPDVLDMLLSYENALVREAAFFNLVASARQPRLIPLMKNVVPKIFGIFKTKDSSVRVLAFSILVHFSVLQPELSQYIKSVLGPAIKEFLNQNTEFLSWLSELFNDLEKSVGGEISQDIKHSIQRSLEMLQDDKLWTQNTYLGALVKVLENSGLINPIKRLVLFKTNKFFISIDKPDHAEVVIGAINDVLDMLQDESFWSINIMVMLTKLFEQPKVQQAIKILTPLIATILKEFAFVITIDNLDRFIKRPMLSRAIKDSLPVVIDILENEALYTADAVSNILNEMLNQQEIIHLIQTVMPTIKTYLLHDNPVIRAFSLFFLRGISCKSDLFIHEIQHTMLTILNMRNDGDDYVREGVTKWLEELSKQPELNQFIKEWEQALNA